MAIIAGIDEAGFGPLLGPLVVSGVAFRVPEGELAQCLWETLRVSCTSCPQGVGHRLLVADSKLVHHSRHGLAKLERTAMVMTAVAGARPATWRALLDVVAPGAAAQLDRYPWYAEADTALPVTDGVGDVGTQSNAVRHDAACHGISFLGAFSEPLPEGEYNAIVRRTRNKSVVLLGLVLRVLDRILRLGGGECIHLCIDRLGGRTHYRETLMTAMPDYDLQVLQESPVRSAYALTRSAQVCDIEFVTDADRIRFSVALASIYSKYLRELYMHAFNRYWSGQIAGLVPTAGYYVDAQRWLRDAGDELRRRSIDPAMLVRER